MTEGVGSELVPVSTESRALDDARLCGTDAMLYSAQYQARVSFVDLDDETLSRRGRGMHRSAGAWEIARSKAAVDRP